MGMLIFTATIIMFLLIIMGILWFALEMIELCDWE